MSIIRNLQSDLYKNGHQINSKNARIWFKAKIRELNLRPKTLMKDYERLRGSVYVGKMFFFFYNPKTKEKLPYYDIFPLVIPLERYHDGFLGLNLHYVAPRIRLYILDILEKTRSNEKMNDTTRMKINYEIVSRLDKYGIMKDCIKRYLTSHIQSRFLLIGADEWHFAASMPFEIFRTEKKGIINKGVFK